MAIILTLFLYGIGYELAYLAWLYYNDRSPWISAVLSMVVGVASFYGVSSAIHNPSHVVWLILGYGVGSYLAAIYKRYKNVL